jgi:hypothetical protein
MFVAYNNPMGEINEKNLAFDPSNSGGVEAVNNIDQLDQAVLSRMGISRVFLLCSELEHYLQVTDPGTIVFNEKFLSYFNKLVATQTIIIDQNKLHEMMKYSDSEASALVLLVTETDIISVNGALSVKSENITEADIMGAYLLRDNKQFFANDRFDLTPYLRLENNLDVALKNDEAIVMSD